MKKFKKYLFSIILCMAIFFSICTGVNADDIFDKDIDYLSLMIDDCINGNVEDGRQAAEIRNRKIDELGLPYAKIEFNDLYELAKIITAEAGSYWLPIEWKMRVGEVVLNRVESPEFPDTIYEVVHQRGQYSNANSAWYEKLIPYDSCVEAAVRLLNGERLINNRAVVFQAQGKQGSGTYLAMYDSYYGYTYLCYSSHMELYEDN